MPKLPQILAVPEKAPLYGSSRLGSRKERVCMTCTTATLPAELQGVSYVIRGEKSYELSNHLGNVLAVVSDRREAGSCTDSLVDFYYADGRSVSDYYPFGMAMDSRTQSAVGYRWGFNGMEKDDEVKDLGNQYTTFWRQYDPRLGRWMNPDPLMKKFAAWSPYNFAFNNPINLVDIHGNGPGDEKGKERAKTAQTIASTDKRTYDQIGGDASKGNQTVDCSEFCREIAEIQGYDPGRDSRSQAAYYQKNGEYSTDIKDAKIGDFIFWGNNGRISHTGVITEISEDGIINVISAELAGATKGDDGDGGVYQGGGKSLTERTLTSDGAIWRSRNGSGGTAFIGVGRPILSNPDAAQVMTEKEAQDVHQEVTTISPNTASGTNTTSSTPAAAKPATSTSYSLSGWWSGVKSEWNQFWSDLSREVNNPYNYFRR